MNNGVILFNSSQSILYLLLFILCYFLLQLLEYGMGVSFHCELRYLIGYCKYLYTLVRGFHTIELWIV